MTAPTTKAQVKREASAETKVRVEHETSPDAILCRACDNPLAIDQAYCLRCGEPALGVAPMLPVSAPPAAFPVAATVPSAFSAGRLLPNRRLAGVMAGGLALLVGGVLFGAAIAGDEQHPAQIRVQVPAAKAPVVNVSVPAAAAAETPFVSDWPDRSGWTVQLEAIPKQGGAAAAAAAKSAAAAQGAPGAGALDSDDHSALDGGQYVVFSKYYRTKGEATAAARRLRADFPGAKAIRVTASGGGGSASAKVSDRKLDDLEKSSGDDFVKKSKKLPDKVESEGTPPPKDDKPAGAGDTAETIG